MSQPTDQLPPSRRLSRADSLEAFVGLAAALWPVWNWKPDAAVGLLGVVVFVFAIWGRRII